MTNEEAINELEICRDIIKKNGMDWLDERDLPVLDMAIETLEQTRWIPVSEMLPEEKGMYLVTVQDYVLMEQWSGTGWWATRPTAWMPLPTPFLEPTCEQKGED